MTDLYNEIKDAQMIAANLLNQGEELEHICKCLNGALPSTYIIEGYAIKLLTNNSSYFIAEMPGVPDAYHTN